MTDDIQLTDRPNLAIRDRSAWSVTALDPDGKHVTFRYVIVNGWQRRHETIDASAQWEYPDLDIISVRAAP